MDFGLKSSVIWEWKRRWQIWFCAFSKLEILHTQGNPSSLLLVPLPSHGEMHNARMEEHRRFTFILFIWRHSQEGKNKPVTSQKVTQKHHHQIPIYEKSMGEEVGVFINGLHKVSLLVTEMLPVLTVVMDRGTCTCDKMAQNSLHTHTHTHTYK